MSHIFISYSKKNQDYARRLAEYLEQAGFRIWIDADIGYGMKWFKEIEKGITFCAAMIVIMTPEAEDSEWVEKEVIMALDLKKAFFPFLLSGKRWNLFNNIQFIDVTHQGMPDEKFLKRLAEHVKPNPSPTPIAQLPQPTYSQVPDILPTPFEWILIPSGKVTLESGQVYEIPAFQIAKYPITNSQYEVFLDSDDGYNDMRWWNFLNEALIWRGKNESLLHVNLDEYDMPRTSIAWYDAIAFCRWLSHKTGENIILPTDQQWQRAAQGDDGRKYPWGNEFDKSYANTKESQLKRSTCVTDYHTGGSPYLVMDMGGNVWEWSLTEYDNADNFAINTDVKRSIRGGSWRFPANFARVFVRWHFRYNRANDIGFRICRIR